ncbi:hypothetical protein LCGC14_1257870 [marine sediment metagenome]|uniref:Uncharacterized protein n=1 Tax=marine sediment metagenome TaxID=412755 RepID=A0A0F9L481_9ZZZZ|nr:hypothetical protein [Candidatus Aminicenantes bacterium]
MLEPQEKGGFTHPIKGPPTIKIAIKDAREIVERIAKEKNFKLTGDNLRIDWPPMSSQFIECLQLSLSNGEYFVMEYVLFTIDTFWDNVEIITLNAIKELNRCSNLKKKRSLTD